MPQTRITHIPNTPMRPLFFLLILICALTNVEVAVAAASDSIVDEFPIVLSASRLKQTAETSPAAITVIDRQMIDASGFTEIPDLLRLVPGFFVEYDSGHVQAAGYHFLTNRYARQLQVLVDGRSVYTPSLGGVPWSELPLTIDDIERIEVIRGPNAVTYGSNSFLGVVNIITRHAALDMGTSIKTNLGTHHLRETFLRHGNGSNNLDYRINIAYRSDDGFDNRYDDKIVRILNFRSDYQINNHHNIIFQAGYNEGPRQEDNVFSTSVPAHERYTVNQYQQIRWEHKTRVDDTLHVQLYHNRNQDNNAYTLIGLPVEFNEGIIAERTDIELQKNGTLDDTSRYVYGISLRQDRVKSVLYFGVDEYLNSYYRRLFGQIEYQLGQGKLFNVGAMLEDNSITDTSISPRVSYNQQLAENKTLRASFSRATRTPVIFEASPDAKITTPVYDQLFYDAGEVTSETITAYDIGVIAKSPELHLQYDLRIFYENVKRLIGSKTTTPYSDNDNEASYFNNFDDALIRGAEMQFDWRPDDSLRLHGTLAHIEIDSENIRGEYTIAAPVTSSSLLGMYRITPNLQTSMGIYHRSRMAPIARKSSDPVLMPPVTRIDLRIAHDFDVSKTRHTVAVVAQNITDDDYFSRLNNIIDRRFYLSYQIKY